MSRRGAKSYAECYPSGVRLDGVLVDGDGNEIAASCEHTIAALADRFGEPIRDGLGIVRGWAGTPQMREERSRFGRP